MPEALLDRQRDLAAYTLGPAPDPDPALGIPEGGLRAYRRLVRLNLVDPIEDMYPVTRALLEGAGAWEPCVQAFLEARVLASPHYRDIAPAFLGWLHATAWGQDRWPFLLELVHFELVEVLVARHPAERLQLDLRNPRETDRILLDPAALVLSYAHAVQEASEATPEPTPRPTHLLAFRDREDTFRLRELTPATAALLVRAQSEPLGPAARSLGLDDLSSLWPLLRDLQDAGAVAGFQPLS